MGEYATRRCNVTKDNACGYETIVKVGTCDDWRYVRRSEAERLAIGDAGGGTNFAVSLAEPSILYRFPFPDEDEEEHRIDKIGERDMFRAVGWGVAPDMLRRIAHDTKTVGIQARQGAYNVNVLLPCPASGELASKGLRHSPIPDRIPITLHGERWRGGARRTIFACGYCGVPFSLGVDEVDLWRAVLVEHEGQRDLSHRAWAEAIAARIFPREPEGVPA